MSLLPMKSLSGSLPVLFIEARLQGPPEIVFSQMGISFDTDKCNIALLMRTSGVLLVASVGSYMMYRVCARLLGRNFIWTILEQARFDLLARDETYLLNPRMSYLTSNEYDSCCSGELTSDEQSICDSHIFTTGHLRQADGSAENSRKRSDMTSENQNHSASMTSRSSHNAGFTSSEKSASLHLLWDDPQWDEETDFCLNDDVRRDYYSVSSDVSDMTEFRAAKRLFEEPDDHCNVNKEDQRSHENAIGYMQLDLPNREERNTDLDGNDFIQKNSMVDYKHLYQITTGFTTRTNSISLSSERSSQSFPSLRQRLIANASSGGLLELVQSSITSPISSVDHVITSMTDSGISRGTISTLDLQSSIRSAGAKGTFGIEILSNEVDALDMMVPCTLTTNRNSVIGRNNLNLISEDRCSTATSARSMEWFEDDYCSFVTNENLRKSLETDMDNPLAACFSRSGSDQIRPSSWESRRKHLHNFTRDLMAWARDQLAPKSPQMKALQSLYVSDQRWRRIGLKRSSNCLEQFLSSLLHLMFIRGIPFLSCSNALIAAEAVRRVFSRYEFVRQWSFTDGSTKVENKEEYAISLLQNLWDLQHGVVYLKDERVERHCMEAVRLLVLLWIVHCFEKMEAGQWQQHCPSFYTELFGDSNPRQIIQSLYKAQLNDVQMTLLADTLRIRLELLDYSYGDLDAEQPKILRSLVPQDTGREITSEPILTFLKLNRHNFLYPLYHSWK
uniref:Pecanex-like protein n=1 Tax=Loa loa TaxID=7209 RepID=A0A1I7VXE8_LOALO